MDSPSADATATRPALARLDSAFRTADGRPRFSLQMPRSALDDPGVRALVRGESERGGYEYPSRAFLDAHLRPDDLFIDVGAHWGIYALHAATRHPGRVRALAIEAHPGNIGPLTRAVGANRLADAIEIVATAAGSEAGTAPLMINSTMGHSLYGLGLPEGVPSLGQITVAVLPLDLIVGERTDLAGRRMIIKIDVEGFEPEVIAGAARLLDSGRIAAVIWEHGSAFRTGERRDAMLAMCRSLQSRGFRQFRFPHPTMGGPLVAFAPTPECYNVFALAPDIEPLPLYAKPDPRPEPMPPLERAPDDPATRAAVTEMLIEYGASDAARWADFEAMRGAAGERALLVAPLIPGQSRVLDVGAGVMALRPLLANGCVYVPVDLLPFDPATVVVDLNSGGFADGSYDVAVMLDVLEFIHDPERVLTAAAAVARRLLVSYRPVATESVDDRRRLGFFNDLTSQAFEALLGRCGWTVSTRSDAAGLRLFDCRKA